MVKDTNDKSTILAPTPSRYTKFYAKRKHFTQEFAIHNVPLLNVLYKLESYFLHAPDDTPPFHMQQLNVVNPFWHQVSTRKGTNERLSYMTQDPDVGPRFKRSDITKFGTLLLPLSASTRYTDTMLHSIFWLARCSRSYSMVHGVVLGSPVEANHISGSRSAVPLPWKPQGKQAWQFPTPLVGRRMGLCSPYLR